ncbi:hypothetical protein ZIOFF_001909 [Zingiber officinale]|uniref:Pentatricopeptide repeat-containing protein n=1 Tax=Zingiber officinale TaxID=94328 RepID=A0A8J5LVF0_ZINOF|nr:hypothetical protein ZIOFF_001909 [Zingiber officinale]
MSTEGYEQNSMTYTYVLAACTSILDLGWGKHHHAHIIRSQKSIDVFFGSALVDMYAKCGDLGSAKRTFDGLHDHNSVSWTAIIAEYAHSGLMEQAIELFNEMRNVPMSLDPFTLATVVSACCTNLDLCLGTQIHSISLRTGSCSSVAVSNALVIMYGKCGSIENADSVFQWMPVRDIISWTKYDNCIFSDGKFLSGRSHSGLVEEGKFYFNSMSRSYNIAPGLEHFACMVDLLSRAGLLEDAKTVIGNMPLKPSVKIWGALLAACKLHGNKELTEYATKHLFELDLKDSGSYVLLAKMYADAGNSDDSARVRKLMKEKGIKKNPGCSWIEVKNTIHVFTADDPSHPQIGVILKKLYELIKEIEAVGYDHKATSGCQRHHSEKLAMAFGLISLIT